MIIPTPDFDPMFADDAIPFRTKMLDYIRREFVDILGAKAGLLRSDHGLEMLATMFRAEQDQSSHRKAA